MSIQHLMNFDSKRPEDWINRKNLVATLELVQDLIIVLLCFGLFSFMIIQLRNMYLSLLPPLKLSVVTADILFLLILVELFRLLIIYLKEKRVSIGVTVEVSIVSILREVIVKGLLEIPWPQVLVSCIFLLTLACLLVVRTWLSLSMERDHPRLILVQRGRQHHLHENRD
ncbi:phosphate-starvation-inducible PsiE family protein [Lyngbya confervoides]|uniref:Phosphate-starvation-inducible PsiE family protein n=1 Tax=Lyngbya confervoides BDU141951 TaxID=1574623 RepID=A0ABD4T6Y5_9CYAN|nr:phosphate-starvation-inducible PsiE family protein [Lyngbya confervoides]MCM1984474.1 phosphate-starvation-inducible PsiE family protein [Lyngbya confervoides BDU141951]